MARGDLAAARAALEGIDAKSLSPRRRMAVGLLQGLLALIAGEHAAAAEAARAGLAAAESEGLHGWHAWLRMLAAAAALLSAAGAGAQAEPADDAGPDEVVAALHAGLVALAARGSALSREERYTALRPLVTRTHDLEYIGQLAIRRHWSALTAEQQAELENFRKKAAETRRDLKELRKNLRVETDALELWTKVVNIGLVPMLITLAGLVIALGRRRKQRAAA